MNAEKCLSVLREIKDVSFASVNKQGQPRVRIIDVMYVNCQELVFCTSRGKDFYQEICLNPYVGITGLTPNYEMIRLHGQVKKIAHQKEWIDKIFIENPSMNNVYPNESRYILEAFYLDQGEIEYFNLGKEPIDRMYFSLGNSKEISKGYQINEKCIGCGKCKKLCPQQCIEKGKPYHIHLKHCLHCGLCYENCPVRAIQRITVEEEH